jgi:hypothetical protein
MAEINAEGMLLSLHGKCSRRGGEAVEQEFAECQCSKVRGGFNCSTRLKVYCEGEEGDDRPKRRRNRLQ